MAAFRIHEDKFDSIPCKRMDTACSNNPIQQKRMVLKEIDVQPKRLPLKLNNHKFTKVNNKLDNNLIKKVQVKPLNQVKKKQEVIEVEKENNCVQNTGKINHVPDFKVLQNKEIDLSLENVDYFHLTNDHIFLATKEYQEHIYRYLLHLERNLKRPKYDYMEKQPEINYKMRSILIDWLSSVSEEYNLHPQTFHLAVHYLDTFLSRMSVVKNKLQLVGTAAMLIASKYEEIYPPDTKEFTYLTADSYTIKQLLRMEQLMLKVLQFDLSQPTTFAFIVHLSAAFNLSKKGTLLAMYFSELILLEGDEYLKYFPSQLAFASIALARHTLQENEVWPCNLQSITGYSLKQLTPLIKRQYNSFKDSPTRAQQAIQEKYRSTKYGRVSLLKPRTLDLDDLEE